MNSYSSGKVAHLWLDLNSYDPRFKIYWYEEQDVPVSRASISYKDNERHGNKN